MPDEGKTPEEILAEKAAETAKGGEGDKEKTQPAATGPFTVTTKDGSTYTDKTQEGLIEKLVQAKGDTGLALRDREGQLYERPANPPPLATPPSSSTGLDQKGYLDMADVDFEGAVASAMESKLGLNKGELTPSFQRIQTGVDDYITDKHIATFLSRRKDFPGGKDNAGKITDLLDSQNRDYTSDNMDSAYQELVREGQITPLTEAQMKAATATPPGTAGGAAAPPDISAGGGAPPPDPIQETLNKFQSMSTDEQREFLNSKEYSDYVARQGEK